MKAISNWDARLPKMHAVKTQMARQGGGNAASMPDDLGRMPNALVISSATKLPSWLPPNFIRRAKIQWLRLKTAAQDCFSIIYLQWWDAPKDPVTGKRMSKPLEFSNRTEIAKALHRTFNTALAEGDTATIEKIACTGLVNSAKSRIQRRKRMRVREEWGLRKYMGINYPRFLQKWPLSALLPGAGVKVIQDRLAPLPFPNSSFRQCTVRIDSVQLAKTASMSGNEFFNVTEYVVIQKLTLHGKEQQWKLWGTVEPSTMEDIDKLMGSTATSETLASRLRDNFSNVTGMM
ncbi:hypothetical protein LTR10_022262 [Elasticomyces elasticus]|uniref:Tim44-like domain-containing protein n=1 Tax=Exophiala sideris TaxID=1016849 RepID=A0ABR0JT58_9EURO|nr:hypothetical protein LTR10_022262 [Elasticomyces elasticus]KAK5040474.1 hypothetical protein LTS07_000972 [Exophiala sideris]KAK5043100.1 hypothetical protein LTR13_000871 [Exophiala sideris]KAK5068852.1 hypothetical protein LTR69_000973 [Exophiala sideris]KAK5186448.1 hypothetical protein LTR44_001504 [Eurotiomycetes sp. CCFEE 6388]